MPMELYNHAMENLQKVACNTTNSCKTKLITLGKFMDNDYLRNYK